MSTVANPTVRHYRYAGPITGGAHEAWVLLGSEDTSFELDLDTDYAIIIKVGNDGDMSASGDWQLQYNVAAAGWNPVDGASSNFRSAASGDADGATSTTERLGTSAQTFQTSILDEVDGLIGTNITGGNEHELYFTFNVRSAELSGGESIEFRLTTGGATFTHNVTISATIAAAADNHIAELPAQTLTLTPFAPQAITTENHIAVLPSAALTLTPFAPDAVSTDKHIAVLPSVALTLAPFAPQVISTDVNVAVLPAQTLTLTPFAPQVVTTEGVQYEQEGFRFRNDDGTEITASWRQTQDVDDEANKQESIRLRVLTDTNADAPSITRTLQYKRDDEAASEWRDI